MGNTLLHDERGQTLLEFGLSVLTLVLVVFAAFEFCMVIYTYATLGDAAQEGIRYAIIHGADSANCSGPSCTDSTGANVKAVVNSVASASLHNIASITITPSWPDSSAQPGSRVKVQITYNYIPYVSIPGNVAPQMNLTAEGRIVF